MSPSVRETGGGKDGGITGETQARGEGGGDIKGQNEGGWRRRIIK